MDPVVRNRRDLACHLQDQMVAARMAWPTGADADDDEGRARTSVKTYLLEAHRHAAEKLSAAVLLRQLALPLGVHVEDTDDEGLFHLRAGGHDFWCDTSLARYWRLHTMTRVEHADALHLQLVNVTSFLDNVWLPPSYLEMLADRTGLTDALSSAVAMKVDFDLVLSVVATGIYRLLGMRVFGPTGAPKPTMPQSAVRNAFTLLSAVPYFGGLLASIAIIVIAVTINSSPTKQGKHDEMAGGTQVVKG
jgi:hypothetical protein